MGFGGKRSNGVLMHITSLPSEYGIGDLGEEAYEFASLLKKAGVNYWQILPLCPTGFGNSPYSGRSTFAGNELFISPSLLYKEGLIEKEDLVHPPFPDNKVDFSSVIKWKMTLLKKAGTIFIQKNIDNREFLEFIENEEYWIEDYAIFMTLYEKYNDARWYSVWEENEKNREENTINKIKIEKGEEILIWKALQFIFYKEWIELKTYVNSLKIQIIGDIPIFVGKDSADAWSHRELLKINKKGEFLAQAGVPPDAFSPNGQLWGNPVYNWEKNKKEDFKWWEERFKHLLKLTDVIRIDHFKAFDSYWEVKANDKTAKNGRWVKSPGAIFFSSIKKSLGSIPLIAEDLGYVTENLKKLRDNNNFPGMKIAIFGFSRDKAGYPNTYDEFLPINYTKPFVAYTGTHDNDTVRSWFDSLNENDKHMVREYLACNNEEVVWALIRALMMSQAETVIIPMQDILQKGHEARMNTPATCNDKNWSWRIKKGEFSDYFINRYAFLARISGRNNLTEEENLKEELKEINTLK